MQRLAEWSDRDGFVVLECPKPAYRRLKDIGAWFSWWTGPQRIRLDETGSSMWRLFDGESSLREVAATLRDELGDDVENLEGRIDLFVSTLYRRRMIQIIGDDPRTPS